MSNNYKDNEITQYLKSMPLKELQQKSDQFRQKQELSKYDKIIDHMTLKNNGDPIKFHDSWRTSMWHANSRSTPKKVIVNGKPVPVNDMDFYIAESLQTLQAGQDPEAEYYSWVDQAKIIIKDMQVDGTTLEELRARDNFVHFLDDRETELKRVISLYAGAAFNGVDCPQKSIAQEKLKFLTFKLSELRRIRERMENVKPERPPRNKNYLKLQDLPPELREKIVLGNSNANNINLDDEEELDASAAAVALASHLCAVEVMRAMREENSNKNINEQNNQLSNEELPEQHIENARAKKHRRLRQWLMKLSGRTQDEQQLKDLRDGSQRKVRTFNSKEYEEILAMHQREYDGVY